MTFGRLSQRQGTNRAQIIMRIVPAFTESAISRNKMPVYENTGLYSISPVFFVSPLCRTDAFIRFRHDLRVMPYSR